MTVEVCPACGYPTLGPELCAFCRSVEMLSDDKTFEPNAWDRSGHLRVLEKTVTSAPTAI
ncbi:MULTISPECIES: hypothetical protein [unclassified Mycobacterium]|uniref:hypothetical protein n=1 Tax=unclassified Mycobacterium TaxID=2642494 RepID=UPI0012EA5E8E|nr:MULTISPECIES: hypothetical protein [unclassified Mycobacterium]